MIYFLTDGLFRVAETERVIVKLYEQLSIEENIKIFVPGDISIAFNTEKKIPVVSLNVGDLPRNIVGKIKHRLKIYRLSKKKISPRSVVFSFSFDLNLLNIILTRFNGGYSVVCEHIEYSYHNFFRRLLRAFAYRLKNVRVVCLTETDRIKYSNIGIDAIVIPNFIEEKNNEYNSQERLILAIGRLVPQKNFLHLLNSFYCSEVFKDGWRLVIVGEGDGYASLMHRINECHLNEYVEIHKFSKNIERIKK